MNKKLTPNPAGRAGKPFIIPNMKFDDALRKILQSPPEPKAEKPAKKKSSKKR